MQFLKILFWVVAAIVATIFSIKNWEPPVTLNLWGDLQLLIRLPLLLAIAFAGGLLPMALYHAAARFRLRRRIEGHERALAELRASAPAPVEPAVPVEVAQS